MSIILYFNCRRESINEFIWELTKYRDDNNKGFVIDDNYYNIIISYKLHEYKNNKFDIKDIETIYNLYNKYNVEDIEDIEY